ncbi:MAG: DUF1003 domain-containing protein [Pirellulaceae bacterium]
MQIDKQQAAGKPRSMTLASARLPTLLSTFVLLTQNRQAAVADLRSDLDLQINLLAELEITRLLVLVDRIAEHLGVEECNDPELAELEEETAPEAVLQKLDQPDRASE